MPSRLEPAVAGAGVVTLTIICLRRLGFIKLCLWVARVALRLLLLLLLLLLFLMYTCLVGYRSFRLSTTRAKHCGASCR